MIRFRDNFFYIVPVFLIIIKDRPHKQCRKIFIFISVDQYWERLKPGIKKAMIRGKYKEKMKKEYKEEFMSDDIDYTDFDKYYEDKISDLMKNMKIKKYID